MSASVSQTEQELFDMRANASQRSTTSVVSEGILAGVLAAAAVAAVFLAIDLAAGEPFRTPRQLGGLLLTLIGGDAGSADSATPLALYTLFHFVAFIGAGIIAAMVVQVSIRTPVAILLFAILFCAFEVLFTGLVAFLDLSSVRTITPVQVALGNVVASVVMVLFFGARHPRLRNIHREIQADEDGDR